MKISNYLIEEGYVKKINHPTEELYLYNYTAKAQFEGMNSPIWKDYPELNWCRGLILNKKDDVVARPFPKFWNYEQYAELPAYNSFEVYDKADGSHGILYPTSTGMAVATRGSFTSEQAIWATEFLNKNYTKFIEDNTNAFTKKEFQEMTFLLEIIYPENKIVVDYAGKKDLVLLTIMNTVTGIDWPRSVIEFVADNYNFNLIKEFDGITDFTKVRELLPRDNAEGFVIKFDTGLRVKMKYEEYFRLHKIVTGVSSKTIWGMLRLGQSFNEILELVPDEFHQWVEKVKKELEEHFALVNLECDELYNNVKNLTTRKEQAQYLIPRYKAWSAIVFRMLDNKPYSDLIWKLIEPNFEQPFKTGGDDE